MLVATPFGINGPTPHGPAGCTEDSLGGAAVPSLTTDPRRFLNYRLGFVAVRAETPRNSVGYFVAASSFKAARHMASGRVGAEAEIRRR